MRWDLIATLLLMGGFAFAAPILAGAWAHRRWQVPWKTWGHGALAFVASQVVRIPLLIGLTLGLNALWKPDPPTAFVFNLVVLAGTSGLFEETARLIVLEKVARDARSFEAGVMFGLGHGGVEAVLFVGLSAVANATLLLGGAWLLGWLGSLDPKSVEGLTQALGLLHQTQWHEPLLGAWERVPAMTFHVGATLLVLHTVRTGRWRTYVLAMLLHALINAAALVGMRYWGAMATEGLITVLALLPVAVIVHLSRRWRAEAS